MSEYSCKKHGRLEDKDKIIRGKERRCRICNKEWRKQNRSKEENMEKKRFSDNQWYEKNCKTFLSREEVRSYPPIIDMSKEIWRPIESYEDYYAVSNFGRVRSEARIVETVEGKLLPIKEKILKQSVRKRKWSSGGTVTLCKGHTKKYPPVARLVMHAFFRQSKKTEHVMHKDNNYLNNRIDNLFYEDKGSVDYLTEDQIKIIEDESIKINHIRKKITVGVKIVKKYREKIKGN